MNISRQLEDKKSALDSIEQKIADVSDTVLSSLDMTTTSKLEQNLSTSSNRVERTLGYDSPNRSRDGDTRLLLSLGALGSPRDQHGSAPDAAVSTVQGRKFCEGTAGVALASASAEQAATGEHKPVNAQTVATFKSAEKRKASNSPRSEVEDGDDFVKDRPTKARIITSTESPEDRKKREQIDDQEYESIFEIEDDTDGVESEEVQSQNGIQELAINR